MKNIILAFDKFKGSLTSAEAADAAERGIRRVLGADAVCHRVPTADGGEGTTDAFLTALGGEKVSCQTAHPRLSNDMCIVTHTTAEYGILPNGTCVMEMAAASGLALVAQKDRNPFYTTTFGTGQMILDALDRGCREFLIGIGGSATNDGGAGMAAALGAEFLDGCGRPIPCPTGGTLAKIEKIRVSHMDARLAACHFTVCCDVENPLCGENGAAYVYAEQKGAAAEQLPLLDAGLAHFAQLCIRDAGAPKDIAARKGSGAAGGLGAGMYTFLHAKMTSGADAVMDAAKLDALLQNADLLLTGEGKLDGQTVCGKVVCGLCRRAEKAGVPVVAVGGCADEGAEGLYALGIRGIYTLNDGSMKTEESMYRAKELLEKKTEEIVAGFFR